VSCKSEDGDDMLMYYIKPGESCVLSFLGALHHQTSKVQAEIIEDVELLVVSPEQSVTFLKQYPDWSDYFFKLYDKRFEEMLNMLKLVTFENMEARIMRFLVERARLGESKVIYITHEKLASELAAARVVVSRLLKQMEMQKQVILGRGYIKLLV
jgi:CRP/FNR family transcriptional regulator